LLLYSSNLSLGVSQLAGHLLHQLHANKFSGTIHHRAITEQRRRLLTAAGHDEHRAGSGRVGGKRTEATVTWNPATVQVAAPALGYRVESEPAQGERRLGPRSSHMNSYLT
jgi:hypothetical protein